jgi:crotonobetainyl-CoA:carnitine CoA-transferase CaiB-like acyl-CoA transferase
MLLADLGAEVIKVERPGLGEETRAFGVPLAGTTASHAFMDRGKRSVALDLKDPDGLEAARRLIATADAVVESFRPGVADRLGLGDADVRAGHPRLVYCSVNGYGTGGPREQAAGHDLDYLAYAGAVGFGGTHEHGPAIAGVQSADIIGGLLGLTGLLAALIGARETGEGERVEVALADGALWAIGLHVSSFLAGSPARGPESTTITGATPSYRIYRCADGRHLAMGAVEPQFWQTVVEAIGRPELIARQDDPAVIGELEALFATRPREEWLQRLENGQSCVAPVQDFAEVARDPQFAARQMLIPTPGAPEVPQVAMPIRLDRPLPPPAPAAAQVGRDGAEVLAELDLAPEVLHRIAGWAFPSSTETELERDRV